MYPDFRNIQVKTAKMMTPSKDFQVMFKKKLHRWSNYLWNPQGGSLKKTPPPSKLPHFISFHHGFPTWFFLKLVFHNYSFLIIYTHTYILSFYSHRYSHHSYPPWASSKDQISAHFSQVIFGLFFPPGGGSGYVADMLASISSFGAQDAGRAETTEAMTSLAPEVGPGMAREDLGEDLWRCHYVIWNMGI